MAASKQLKKKSKTASRQQDTGNRFQTEILILVMFAACLILMISAFGMGGIVGNAISSVCFGIMGLCAYLFPIVLFGGVTFLIVNNKNCLAYKRFLQELYFYFSVRTFTAAYRKIYTEYDLCGLLCAQFRIPHWWRSAGRCCLHFNSICIWHSWGVVIIVLVLLVSMIIITQRSFWIYE